jgi:hypothetical protein
MARHKADKRRLFKFHIISAFLHDMRGCFSHFNFHSYGYLYIMMKLYRILHAILIVDSIFLAGFAIFFMFAKKISNMSEQNVVVLQGSDIKKLQEDLAALVKSSDKKPSSITQSQSAVPVIGSRMGWENIITITVVYAE